MAIYRFGYEPILRRPPYVALIASIGLYIAMEELFRIVFGPFGLTYDQVPMQGSVVVAGMHLRTAELATVALAAGLIGGLCLLAGRTRLGLRADGRRGGEGCVRQGGCRGGRGS